MATTEQLRHPTSEQFVELVVAAYRKTGLKAKPGVFFESDDAGMLCGCAFSALYLADKDRYLLVGDGRPSSVFVDTWAKKAYGGPFTNGCVDGFDGNTNNSLGQPFRKSAYYLEGYACGVAALAAVVDQRL